VADLPRFNDLFRIARDTALVNNSRLSREIVQRQGTDANILMAAAAAVGEEVVGQLQLVEASLFLDSATGTDLDRLVFDRYGLVRKPAAAAFGTVQFSTTALNPGAFTIAAGTNLQTTDGIQYSVTTSITFPASTVGPVTAIVRSLLAGVDQQAKAGTITSIISSISGSPSDLVVTNAAATAGADDEETDTSLRARARAFFTTARRGTKSALEQGALAVPGVTTASAIEVLDTEGAPARVVQLVVSDQFTETLASFSETPSPTYQAQAQALAISAEAGLDDVRALGIEVKVIVASVVLLPVALRLTFQAGVDVSTVTLRARAAAVNYTNELVPGATWDPAVLSDRLKTVSGLYITGNEVLSPSGAVVPNSVQVIRTGLPIVTG